VWLGRGESKDVCKVSAGKFCHCSYEEIKSRRKVTKKYDRIENVGMGRWVKLAVFGILAINP